MKELIKYKGFQVPPAELEALIISHPAVADVAVIGIPDDESGRLPKAFVTLKPDMEVSEIEIRDFVAEKVATYKQIRMVEFIDEIPKSPSENTSALPAKPKLNREENMYRYRR